MTTRASSFCSGLSSAVFVVVCVCVSCSYSASSQQGRFGNRAGGDNRGRTETGQGSKVCVPVGLQGLTVFISLY